jgi:hypothetical protein
MRGWFILPLLLIPIAVAHNQTLVISEGKPDLAVVSHRWSKTRRVTANVTPNLPPPPAPSMADTARRNAERSERINDSGGPRQPARLSIDARAAALEKIARDAGAPPSKSIDGFSYQLKLKNESKKQIEVVFWEYQFIELATPDIVTRRQFLCGLNLKPGKEKELMAFSLSGPSRVVSVQSLANKVEKPPQERVLINRVEYADGTIWQRQDWSFAEIRLSYISAMATPWTEMCRGL